MQYQALCHLIPHGSRYWHVQRNKMKHRHQHIVSCRIPLMYQHNGIRFWHKAIGSLKGQISHYNFTLMHPFHTIWQSHMESHSISLTSPAIRIWTHLLSIQTLDIVTILQQMHCLLVVVILFPEEYNMIHSIHTTFQPFHKCIPLAVAREALWLIELTTAILTMKQL